MRNDKAKKRIEQKLIDLYVVLPPYTTENDMKI